MFVTFSFFISIKSIDFFIFIKVNDSNEIEEFIREGEARIELACHYKNPYPRPV